MGEHRRSRRTLLALACLVIVMASCRGGDEARTDTPPPESAPATTGGSPASASPAASPAESAPASPAGTAGTHEPPVALEADTLAEVIITELVVRTKPSVADDSQILEPVLGEGQRVFVVQGPERASGYWWYQVQPLTDPDATVALPFGWVSSAHRNGDPWLRAVEPDCPGDRPSIEDIVKLAPEERLVCFGHRELTFTAGWRACGTGTVSVEPSWFQTGCAYGPNRESTIFPRVPPDVGDQPGSGRFEFTGHFDDPRAQDCRWVGAQPRQPVVPEQVILGCRTEFVVTSIKPAS